MESINGIAAQPWLNEVFKEDPKARLGVEGKGDQQVIANLTFRGKVYIADAVNLDGALTQLGAKLPTPVAAGGSDGTWGELPEEDIGKKV